MRSNASKLTVFGIMACVAMGGALFAAPESSSPTRLGQRLSSGEVSARSAPSDPRDLAFAQPGLISEVNVKDGETIKTGQVLASQDTSVEEAALAREEFLLKSNVQKRAAVAQLELARVKLARAESLLKPKDGVVAGSQAEYDEAKLEVTVSELKVELAEEETQAKRMEVARLKKQIERMKIVSKFDGEIRKVELAVGEVSDPQKPSIIAVSNHPLHVNTALPTSVANALKIGQTMQVRYLDEKTWYEATVKSLDPVADATTGKRAVKLELANDQNRPAGEEMAVKLPTDLASAKD